MGHLHLSMRGKRQLAVRVRDTSKIQSPFAGVRRVRGPLER